MFMYIRSIDLEKFVHRCQMSEAHHSGSCICAGWLAGLGVLSHVIRLTVCLQ